MDALRPDYMGCYGYKKRTTPNLDEFAKKSAVFTQAISTSSHTAPSNASLVTSTHPFSHGVRDWGYSLSPNIITLPQVLKSNGYETVFISDQLGFSWLKGFRRGFVIFDMRSSFSASLKKRFIDISQIVVNWLNKNHKKPFFLWVYYMDPHTPYLVSSPFKEAFVKAASTLPSAIPICAYEDTITGYGCIPRSVAVDNITDVEYYRSLYRGEIAQTDAGIGHIFDAIKKLGLDKNTIVIFFSDHGEALGEHGQYFMHASSLYDELLKVPLIIHVPALNAKTRRIQKQVSLLDVAPTVLDLIGIKKPKQMQGESLKLLMQGDESSSSDFVWSEWLDKRSVRSEKWKLIYEGLSGTYALYDLKSDPREMNDRVLEERGVFDFLRHKMEGHMRVLPQRAVLKKEFSSEEKETLRSLGYLQ